MKGSKYQEVLHSCPTCVRIRISIMMLLLWKNLATLLANQNTSKMFTQLRVINQNARRSIKKRIELHKEVSKDSTITEEPASTSIEDLDTFDHLEPLFDEGAEEISFEEQKLRPKIGEYWQIRIGKHSLYDKIVAENPLRVKYSEPSIREKFHNLNDKINDVFEADVHKKVTPHQIIHKGKTLVF